MQERLKYPITMLLIVLLTLCMFMSAAAAEGVGFSVSPVIPENQLVDVKGYYDLKMEPGQKQDLTVTVANSGDEDILVKVEAITASTNQGGVINYTSPGAMDESLPFSFAELATIREEYVEIPANSSKNVIISITMPEESYDGYLLGGLQFEKQLTEEELASGVSILNQYSYVVGIKLTETNAVVSPDFSLGEIAAKLENGIANVAIDIHSTQPVMTKGMIVTAGIYPKGSEEAVMERTMEAEMAPNSIFSLPLRDEAGYGVRAGDYLCKVNIEHNGQTWDFEKEFAIKAEEAAYINENALNQQTNQTAMNVGGLPTWAIALIVGGVILLIVVIILLVSMMKRMNKMKKD